MSEFTPAAHVLSSDDEDQKLAELIQRHPTRAINLANSLIPTKKDKKYWEDLEAKPDKTRDELKRLRKRAEREKRKLNKEEPKPIEKPLIEQFLSELITKPEEPQGKGNIIKNSLRRRI